MNLIILEKEGGILRENRPVTAGLLEILGAKVELVPGYSLRSFFRLLEACPVYRELNPFLLPCIKEYESCPEGGCIFPEIEYLELGKTIEMRGFPGKPGIDIYLNLIGIREGEPVPTRSTWLHNLLDMEIRLGELKHIVFGDRVDTFRFEAVFNLFEFIDGIAWELSFHNMPAECRVSFGRDS